MNTQTRVLAASLLFTLLPQVVPLPARAQGDSDPVTAQARARFKEGVDFYDKGSYENARLAFLQAYALKKHPAVLLNLAQSSAKSNHPLEASRYFQQFLREATNVSPQQRQDAESGLAEVRQKLGRIEIVAPAGTEISVDDTKVGNAPFQEPVDVDPGPHTVKSPTETVKVIATVGSKVQAKFGGATTAPPVIAPVPTAGTSTSPPQTTPETTPQTTPATTTPATADTGAAKHTDVFSPPRSMGPVYGGLAVAGIGIAGTIIFAAFKADAQSKADAVANEIRTAAGPNNAAGICTRTDTATTQRFGNACATLRDNNDKVDTNATIANVSAVVAGVGLLTAVGWYLFAPKHEDPAPPPSVKGPSRPTLTPYAGYGSGGFILSGSL